MKYLLIASSGGDLLLLWMLCMGAAFVLIGVMGWHKRNDGRDRPPDEF